MALLQGRVALVTGASRGLGQAIARRLAEEGARVAVMARSRDYLETLAAEIDGLVAPGDISRPEDVERAFSEIEHKLGAVEILINNAAILGPAERLDEADPDAWVATHRVNVSGTFLCLRRALPGMKQQRRGKIVNVSSGAALVPIAGYTAYSSSKAAILHLSVCLAEEVKPYGITVNSVGVWARTDMWEEQMRAPMPAVQQSVDAGAWPSAEENLGAILFLASGLSDHVTGQYLATNSLPDYVKLP